MAERSPIYGSDDSDLDSDGDGIGDSRGSAFQDPQRQQPRPAGGRLWFLGDQEALRKRFVLSEVLGAPLSRRPRRSGGRR